MEYLQTAAKRGIPNYKYVSQLVLIVAAEVILFVIIRQHTSTNNASINPNQTTLVLVQVLFRHGQRTPLIGRSYPNDPYINYTFEPYGAESLTYKGESSMYQLGTFLREYYGDFLGEYHPDIVLAQSSPTSRCKISLALVLTPLFPPAKERQFNVNLQWQPIEYHYNPFETDNIFYNIFNCEELVKLRLAESKRVLENEGGNITEVVRYLEMHTGMKIEAVFDILGIYDTLLVQSELKLKLPKWTESVLPQPLRSYANLEIPVTFQTEALRRLSGGFLLKQMIDAINEKLGDPPKNRNRKIYLYSGHDYNIWAFLGTLGIVLLERPTYGSFISLELHNANSTFGVKVVYHNYDSQLPEVIKLPGCEEFCPLEEFFQLYEKYQATASMC